uniref:Uncharacterized protein n=1 Tax=Latimeria chalumnae TaxID=7897 RepID=H3A821_LATCH
SLYECNQLRKRKQKTHTHKQNNPPPKPTHPMRLTPDGPWLLLPFLALHIAVSPSPKY